MHLLLAQKGTIAEATEAIDLGQSPAEMIVLSAADTELSALSGAYARLKNDMPTLRLANLMALSHPMSVDTYVERTAQHAGLIVARVIGGESYWPYGLESLQAVALAKGIKLAVLSGDNKPDPTLLRFSTIPFEDCMILWRYLVEGGADNADNFLSYCRFLLSGGERPPAPKPLMKAGLWWPGMPELSLEGWKRLIHVEKKPVAVLCFYRALVQSGQTAPVEALIKALEREGLTPLPLFVSSLKDSLSIAILEAIFADITPDIVLNATGFAVSVAGERRMPTVLEKNGAMVLQVLFSATPEKTWQESVRGLSARDLAMNVSLPEVDGRVLTRAVSFKSADYYDEATECNVVTSRPMQNRVTFVAAQAANWVRLGKKTPQARKIALIMANYPGGDGRLGHGVGLDTPASSLLTLQAMQAAGYDVADLPQSGTELIHLLMRGPTNEGVQGRLIRESISINDYNKFFEKLPLKNKQEMLTRWGEPETDAYVVNGAFALPVMRFGGTIVGAQPERAYGMDAKQVYHDPDIVPSHHYMAFYFWLRHIYGADAIIHMGKHGNLEWLPGKALALSDTCYPELALGPTPHIYPFIVNDPGEGTQAKRRSSAVIIDHLTPPLARAESYGPLKDLEVLVDEYYEASGIDPRRLVRLKKEILDLVALTGLTHDAGISEHDNEDLALEKLDAFLCELKELQIRDGLHTFGASPQGEQLTGLLVALARVPRGEGAQGSLHRAIADDLDLGFDPLDCVMTTPWNGPRPKCLMDVSKDPWRSTGDTVERVELLASLLVGGAIKYDKKFIKTNEIVKDIELKLKPLVLECGKREMAALLAALDGKFIEPGPSGAPTRGRPDVLPTGRNFYSVDNRAVPTMVAWELGKRSAELLITRYVQDHGEWPKALGLTAWGTANMRTGGDDIAQALALIGVKPVWDTASRRVTGYEIIPTALLRRPRVDVTLRISGFFRDAFPEQMTLFDEAVRAVGALHEGEEDNPIAARMKIEAIQLQKAGLTVKEAQKRAGYRIFGARPGAYGTGVQELIDSGEWEHSADLGRAWAAHSAHAYGLEDGVEAGTMLINRLKTLNAVVQNQDNREHDLLDSGEYYAFEGGMAAAVAQENGQWPKVYHNDMSRPERPLIKTLEEEISRTLRGRAVNPKWIESAMRHGYKGGVEMAATVDYLFAFAATTHAVSNHHFDAIYDAYIADEKVRDFLQTINPAALKEISARLLEATERQLWRPRSNFAHFRLNEIKNGDDKGK